VAIVAVLISMGVGADTRSQLLLSLASWAVVVGVYAVLARRQGHGVFARDVPADDVRR
jgi:hypothetical protein